MSTLSTTFYSNHSSGYISSLESDLTAEEQQQKEVREIYRQTGVDFSGDGLAIEL